MAVILGLIAIFFLGAIGIGAVGLDGSAEANHEEANGTVRPVSWMCAAGIVIIVIILI